MPCGLEASLTRTTHSFEVARNRILRSMGLGSTALCLVAQAQLRPSAIRPFRDVSVEVDEAFWKFFWEFFGKLSNPSLVEKDPTPLKFGLVSTASHRCCGLESLHLSKPVSGLFLLDRSDSPDFSWNHTRYGAFTLGKAVL